MLIDSAKDLIGFAVSVKARGARVSLAIGPNRSWALRVSLANWKWAVWAWAFDFWSKPKVYFVISHFFSFLFLFLFLPFFFSPFSPEPHPILSFPLLFSLSPCFASHSLFYLHTNRENGALI